VVKRTASAPAGAPPRSFYRWSGAALVATAAMLLALASWTDLDLILADHAFDRARNAFPWRDAWFAAVFMHVWVKRALVAVGVGVVVLTAADALRPMPGIAPRARTRLRIVALCALAIPLAIGIVRNHSQSHCPWNIDRYGGHAPYVRLLDAAPPGTPRGHCFPAAHATSALWLAAFAVFWIPHRMRVAGLVFALGLGAGFALGWVQQLRGAHFLSHTLWSLWAAALVVLVVTRLLLGAEPRRAHAGSLPPETTNRRREGIFHFNARPSAE
jgi:membrane-associated PAP2 superfamily phosphatase